MSESKAKEERQREAQLAAERQAQRMAARAVEQAAGQRPDAEPPQPDWQLAAMTPVGIREREVVEIGTSEGTLIQVDKAAFMGLVKNYLAALETKGKGDSESEE